MIDAVRARQARPAKVIVEDVSPAADAVGDVKEVAKAHDVQVALRRLSPDYRAMLFEMHYRDFTARQGRRRARGA